MAERGTAHAHAEKMNKRGLDRLAQGEVDAALAFFDMALEYEPRNVQALSNRGVAFKRLGRFNEASAVLDVALKLDPRNKVSLMNKANVLASLGKNLEAIEYLDSALAVDPLYVDGLLNKGIILAKLGRDDEVVTCCLKALDVDESDADLWHCLGCAYYRLSRTSSGDAQGTQELSSDERASLAVASWLRAAELGHGEARTVLAQLGVDGSGRI